MQCFAKKYDTYSVFLLGFSIIFIAIGFGTSFIGGIFTNYKDLIRQLGGIFIIVFGLIIVGVFKPKFLMQDRKFTFKNRPVVILDAF